MGQTQKQEIESIPLLGLIPLVVGNGTKTLAIRKKHTIYSKMASVIKDIHI